MVNKNIRGNFPADENIMHLNSMSDLKSIIVNEDVDTVVVNGYYVKGDNRSRVATWDANSNLVDNGGTIIIPTYIGFAGTGRWIFNNSTIYARDFGAKGDGITNDTTAIQTFKDYCVLNGRVANLGEGTFNISSTLVWNDGDSGLIFKGSGITQTTLKWVGSAGGTVIRSNSVTGIAQNIHNRWLDFTIDCNTGVNNAFIGLSMTFTYNSITRIRVLNHGTRGIFCQLGFYNLFQNCEVKDGVLGNGASGFFFGDTANANVVHNCRTQNNYNGIRLDIDGGFARPESISITDCTIEGNSNYGIYGQSCVALYVSGCHLESNVVDNIKLGNFSSGSIALRCMLSNNNTLGTGNSINLDAVTETTISNCYINNNLIITANCTNISVIGNTQIVGTITDNGNNTIWMNANTNNFYINNGTKRALEIVSGGLRTDLKTNTNDFRISLNNGTSDIDHVDFIAATSTVDFKVPVSISTTTGGLLLPRLNTIQRNAIVNPIAGTIIWNTTTSFTEVYTGTVWRNTP